MSYFGIGLHIVVAMYFAVHAVRSQQNMYWLMILFAFPMLGSVVYFFAIYMPSVRHSRGARMATRAVTQLVDPNRAVREARMDFDRAPTVEHRMRLGAALLVSGKAQEALEHYKTAVDGPFATDPALLLGFAQAQFANLDYAAARATLSNLFVHAPRARQQPEPALLFARTLAAVDAPDTRTAFEQALACANDAAARCLFADWLARQANEADQQRARSIYAEIVRDGKHWPRYARAHNREWLQQAKSALATASSR